MISLINLFVFAIFLVLDNVCLVISFSVTPRDFEVTYSRIRIFLI